VHVDVTSEKLNICALYARGQPGATPFFVTAVICWCVDNASHYWMHSLLT